MWIDYGKSWFEFMNEKLNKVNTLIKILDLKSSEDISEFLIGDINIHGGLCDCCSLDYNCTVVAYKYFSDFTS